MTPPFCIFSSKGLLDLLWEVRQWLWTLLNLCFCSTYWNTFPHLEYIFISAFPIKTARIFFTIKLCVSRLWKVTGHPYFPWHSATGHTMNTCSWEMQQQQHQQQQQQQRPRCVKTRIKTKHFCFLSGVPIFKLERQNHWVCMLRSCTDCINMWAVVCADKVRAWCLFQGTAACHLPESCTHADIQADPAFFFFF